MLDAAVAAGVSKVGYTSVQGAEEGTAFSPIVNSNRQSEHDVRDSGVDWVIGRNGIYIEPDADFIDTYVERGAELGEFIGTAIAGIYEGIRNGVMDSPSDYETAAGRPHRSWTEYFASLQR